jgi:hypothetical protein
MAFDEERRVASKDCWLLSADLPCCATLAALPDSHIVHDALGILRGMLRGTYWAAGGRVLGVRHIRDM